MNTLTLCLAYAVVMTSFLDPHVCAIDGCQLLFQYTWQDSCYYFSTEILAYYDAMSFCEDHSSHLLFIETTEEQTVIAELVKNTSHLRPIDKDLWIGLKKTNSGGFETVWLDGRKANYTNFEKRSFNGVSDVFRLVDPGYFWHDFDDKSPEYFICETAIRNRKPNKDEPTSATFYITGTADSLKDPSPVETFPKITVIDCAFKCYLGSVCETFLYDVTESICYIGGVTQDPSQKHRVIGSDLIRYEKRNW